MVGNNKFLTHKFIKYDVITHAKLATPNAKKQTKIKQKAKLLHRYILLPYEIKQTHWCFALATKVPTLELKLAFFLILVPVSVRFAASSRAIVQL